MAVSWPRRDRSRSPGAAGDDQAKEWPGAIIPALAPLASRPTPGSASTRVTWWPSRARKYASPVTRSPVLASETRAALGSPAMTRGFGDRADALITNVAGTVRGKYEQVRLAVCCLLVEGHLLIEDVPGTGKTSLAKAIAGSIDGTWKRVQFTPDLLPAVAIAMRS